MALKLFTALACLRVRWFGMMERLERRSQPERNKGDKQAARLQGYIRTRVDDWGGKNGARNEAWE